MKKIKKIDGILIVILLITSSIFVSEETYLTSAYEEKRTIIVNQGICSGSVLKSVKDNIGCLGKQKADNIVDISNLVSSKFVSFIQNLGCNCGGYNCDCGSTPLCGTNTRDCSNVGCMGDSCNCDDYCAHDGNPDDAYPECGNRDNPDGRLLACTCAYGSCNCADACKQYTGNFECNQKKASCGCTGSGCSCPTTDDCAWWDIHHTGSPNGDCSNTIKQCNCNHVGCQVQGRCKSWYCKDYYHNCNCDIFFIAVLLTEDAINMGNTAHEMFELFSTYEFIENIKILYYLPTGIYYSGGGTVNGIPNEPTITGDVLKWVLPPITPGFVYHIEFDIIALDPQELELERMVKASGFCPMLGINVYHDGFGILNIIDNNPPTISNVNHNLDKNSLDISSNVIDDMMVYKVKAIIKDPEGLEDIWEMLKIDGNKYDVNLNCSKWKIGVYTYHIWANDITGNKKESQDYSFTILEDNVPPNIPTITGQSSGKPGTEYEYKFISDDPDGDDLYYCIDWGDESGEVIIGPFPSGEEQIVSHIWNEKGDYTIRAKAQDIIGAESDWATLDVSISKSKQFSTFSIQHFIARLINRFSFFEKILNQII